MDFFGQQGRARSHTKQLVALFILALALTNLGIFLGVAGILRAAYLLAQLSPNASPGWFGRMATHFQASGFWNWELFGWVSLLVTAVIGSVTLSKLRQLSEGGVVVARTLGGRRIAADTGNLDERRLLNVVEEMSIAAGIPAPAVYLLDEEICINALVAGNRPDDAALLVTFGALKLLQRDEMQGVVAHEFSHILNGDMRLNTHLIGWLQGVLGLVVLGRVLTMDFMRGKRTPSGDRIGPILHPAFLGAMTLGIVCLTVGSVGAFMARLIKSAVNRQREYLADAAAVQFTRSPEGLANALKKVGGLPNHSWVTATRAEEASHLFFCDGMRRRWLRFQSTHPPLEKRIVRIYPYFDGKFPRVSVDQVLRESPLTELYRNNPPKHPIDFIKLAAIIGTEAAASEMLHANAARQPEQPPGAQAGAPTDSGHCHSDPSPGLQPPGVNTD